MLLSAGTSELSAIHVDQLEVLVRFRVSNNIVVDQVDIVSGSDHSKLLTRTHCKAYTHCTVRRAKRKYNQPFVAHSEVELAHHSHRLGLQPRN